MVDYLFWTGVEILKITAAWLDITYQELNVCLLIVFHPLLTLLFLLLWLKARQAN